MTDTTAARIAHLEAELAAYRDAAIEQQRQRKLVEAANAVCRRDIEALMSSCDQLEKRNTELEAERDKLIEENEAPATDLGMGRTEARLTQVWEITEEVLRTVVAERNRLRAALKHIMCQHTLDDIDKAIVLARAALAEGET